MKFFKSPFVFIVPSLILGIVIESYVSGDYFLWGTPIVLALLFFVYLSRFRLKRHIIWGFMLAFVGLGGLLMHERQGRSVLEAGQNTFVVSVEETSSSQKVWKKNIVKVLFVKESEEIVESKERVLMLTKAQLNPGDEIMINTELLEIQNKGNPGEFDAEAYWRNKNLHYLMFVGEHDYVLLNEGKSKNRFSLFTDVRESLSALIDVHVQKEAAGVAKALLLGDKGSLDNELRESFGDAGAMHVLAVSGLHVGIIMYLILFVLRWFSRWISKSWALILCLIIMWFYAGVTGFSPSVVRATFMFSVVMMGQMLSRKGNGVNTLFFSAFVLLLINPFVLFDLGFQLSYFALLGIVLFYERLRQLVITQFWLLRKAWEGTAVGIAAQLFTVPLTLYHFHQFPNYFMLTNIGVMLFAGVILALGVLFFSMQWIPMVLPYLGWGLAVGILVLIYFIQFVGSIPGAVASGFELNLWMVVVLYLFLLLVHFFSKYKKMVIPLGGLGLLLIILLQINRYQHYDLNEFVVFNHNDPLVALNYEGEILCLYRKGDDLEKGKFVLNAYRKLYPGSVRFAALEPGETNVQLGNLKLNTRLLKNFLEVSLKGQKIMLRMGYQSMKRSAEENVLLLDMPYLKSKHGVRNLSDGAFRLKM